MATADELAGLPADVRAHVENMDARNTVNGSWNACRAELLRLTSEVAELSEHEDTLRFLYESAVSEGDAARAELAALKRRIVEAATGIAKRSLAPGCLVIEGFDDDPGDFHNERVALLPVGGE